MHYLIMFEDNPQAPDDLRARYMVDHLDFLSAHSDCILSAGPLKDQNGRPAGGVWLVDAASEAAVEALVQSDPFMPTGLRHSWRVLEWSRVFADGQRLI